MIRVFTDGGARGNPGPAAVGIYIEDEHKNKIVSFGNKIGHATNNAAEYKAVIFALEWLNKNKGELNNDSTINFFLDSELVSSQLSGIFKVKNPDLRDLLFKTRELEAELNANISYSYIPREQNVKADRIVNEVLDASGI